MNERQPRWDDAAEIERILARMSVEEQVGQLMVASIPSTTLDEETAQFLRECHVGNAYLLGHNVETPEQLRRLTAGVEALCGAGRHPGLPALIGVDQEGGRVQRLREVGTSFPAAMALGATGSAEHARRWGLATARELRAVGLNHDYAPVFDVNNNPLNPVIGTRSFGESAELVTRRGLAAFAGLREGGVVATAKHFPGHGDTQVDSHLGLPAIEHGLERLRVVELAPYQAAIDAGIPVVMSAHIVFPAWDPKGLPATLSHPVLTDLLRRELGFDGVIISDAMVMKAIAVEYGVVDGAVTFVAVGGDLVLGADEHDRAVYQAVLDTVKGGGIAREQLAASVRRIARLKRWLAAQPPADPAWLNHPEHRAWSAAIARDAVTLLRDDAGALPLRRDARLAVLDCAYTVLLDLPLPESSTLAEALRPRFPEAQGLVVEGRGPSEDQLAAARAAVDTADAVVIGTRSTRLFPGQAVFVEAVLGWAGPGKPVVAVALLDPYDLTAYPAAPTALATYGSTPELLEALAAVLAGDERPRGRLPVSLPGLYDAGHGL